MPNKLFGVIVSVALFLVGMVIGAFSFAVYQERSWPTKQLQVDNQTLYKVNRIFVSSTKVENWGNDLLGEHSTIPSGDFASFDISDSSKGCMYDIMAIMSTRERLVHKNVDLCGRTIWRLGVTTNKLEKQNGPVQTLLRFFSGNSGELVSPEVAK